MRGFHVADPTGAEQTARHARRYQALWAMGPPRHYRMAADGSLEEIR